VETIGRDRECYHMSLEELISQHMGQEGSVRYNSGTANSDNIKRGILERAHNRRLDLDKRLKVLKDKYASMVHA
jgi:hypothetical protein